MQFCNRLRLYTQELMEDKNNIESILKAIDRAFDTIGDERLREIADGVTALNFGGPTLEEYITTFESNFSSFFESELFNGAFFPSVGTQKAVKKKSVCIYEVKELQNIEMAAVVSWNSIQNSLYNYNVSCVFPDYFSNIVLLHNFDPPHAPPKCLENITEKIKNHLHLVDGFLF